MRGREKEEVRKEKFNVVRRAVRIMMWEQVGQSRSKEKIKEGSEEGGSCSPYILPSQVSEEN